MLEPTYTALTQEFVQAVCSANEGAPVAVILVGSVARSTHTSQSDLDLLVVGDQAPIVKRHADRLHVQALTTKQFADRLRAGDDFAAWCVRYGVPLLASSAWLQIVSSPEADTWPDWHNKIRHAARRLTLAATLLETDDIAAATEEMLYAVSHTSRALLFKSGVFPLSRPEIISQLRDRGQGRLAKLLQELSYEQPTRAMLKRDLLYIKRLLVALDRLTYHEFTKVRGEHVRAKKTHSPRVSRNGHNVGLVRRPARKTTLDLKRRR